ncbi:bifunctional alpha,alpha-trehalose-phosphate synthase (UDP-forming)/trehalose-phosphatase [Mucilaginibacter sp. 14171R-50]|uniref:bifunctional alpha,alpha-trehalose-phosphate synthase (UDP-forming)/trehalose-phosphatase n=1 Tax=Mucilaginibacter sp. 14171R-50 TaxID=2703789 RepID=UPI00138BA3D3|nr:bifunctional alpha,alpha-trehalose-phosphate synthase (UDP-forming)/trehalose-phosphatase [Mucilaginibacter sp. 14171R-50]QHS56009.1 bifunctional alpha,alpha-trehalose-phosphate synthase (UDP-forming)/trehalose-phosphatase [Mucilaginibacter sp. 14171R-50]
MNKRLLIVSNRLPLTIEKTGNELTCRQSSGGLIAAVSAYLGNDGKDAFTEKIWIGAPGCSSEDWSVASKPHQSDYQYKPVFIEAEQYEAYYNGFSNSLLWPLFHYFPSYAEYQPETFEAYMDVNRSFAEMLSTQIRIGDVVWIHDYHLLPLAGMLRKRFPDLTIGLFLHIPFPAYELFRVIPKTWQRELLTGMLGADLIGFHTMEYAAYFLSALELELKLKSEDSVVFWDDRHVKVEAFPISIDFKNFQEAAEQEAVAAKRQNYLQLKEDKKMLFSVDRLDYTKGIYNRIRAYKNFLLEHPEYMGKIVFTLVIVPSRDGIKTYTDRKSAIDEYIGDLNGTLGTLDWKPIIYQYQHLEFEDLVALYTVCDVALITPMRDGMNLVAKEFVASRTDQQGVLILSEMAGAAKELTEALLINPNDEQGIGAAIKTALNMPAEEQRERMTAMQERIGSYDVNTWAADFFEQLAKVKTLQEKYAVQLLDTFSRARLLNDYAAAKQRLILLDYDGTLVPFASEPHLAQPTPELLSVLEELGRDERNDVYIISGRDGTTLTKWLGHLPVGLIAEHGAKTKLKNAEWTNKTTVPENNYLLGVEKLMTTYVNKCPHSFIEHKEFSLAWHYRKAEPFQAKIRADELYKELVNYTGPLPLDVLNGHKVIEVRNRMINKGMAVLEILKTKNYDHILCLGDDQTDEDMFKILTTVKAACTIKVGDTPSFAHYNIYSPYQVQSLLQTMVEYPEVVKN